MEVDHTVLVGVWMIALQALGPYVPDTQTYDIVMYEMKFWKYMYHLIDLYVIYI